MPDWKDITTYDFTKDLDDKGWAWEFLRRNQEYRDDWERYKRFKSEGRVYGGKDFIEFYGYLWDKYGVSMLRDPAFDKPGHVFGIYTKNLEYNSARMQVIVGLRGKNVYTATPQLVTIPEGQVALTFDLTRPLGPQLELAKKILKAKTQEERKRPPLYRDKWALYLRVLDARLLNVSYAKIARVLYEETGDPQYKDEYDTGMTGKCKVRDIYMKQALPLTKKGYQYLL